MKKLVLLLLLIITVSCSTVEDDCVQQVDALEAIHKMYKEVLANPQLTERGRSEIILEYEREVAFYNEDPCTYLERTWPEEYD